MKYVVIGANGQLGQDLVSTLRAAGQDVTGLTHKEIAVEDMASVRQACERTSANVLINTAAYHKVDDVEQHPDLAFAVNGVGAYNLAVVCRDMDMVLAHMSTDYVYSGAQNKAYTEADPVNPVNMYGVSKAAGEMAIRSICPSHFIVRSAGLYGSAGPSGKGLNFVDLMLRLADSGKPIRVVDDQITTPTSTKTLAGQILAIIDTNAYGTFHATCQGECTWFDFARQIFSIRQLTPDLSPQSTQESGARAKRPSYSVLDNNQLKQLGADIMPPWQDALAEYLLNR